MTLGFPKPKRQEKTPKPLQRGRFRARKRIKPSNAYTDPRWLKLCRLVAKRSGGFCEVDDCNALSDGQPNHLRYHEDKVGVERLLVPLEWLRAECRPHHQGFHAEHGFRKDRRRK